MFRYISAKSKGNLTFKKYRVDRRYRQDRVYDNILQTVNNEPGNRQLTLEFTDGTFKSTFLTSGAVDFAYEYNLNFSDYGKIKYFYIVKKA